MPVGFNPLIPFLLMSFLLIKKFKVKCKSYTCDITNYNQIKSIINKCGSDFNICLIDDSTFSKLIPGWTTDFSTLADPIKSNIRNLALARLLYNYGGFLIPSSFICLRNMFSLYENFILRSYCL